MIAESIGLALLIVLESLTPPERLALVLHDIYAWCCASTRGRPVRTVRDHRRAGGRPPRPAHGTARFLPQAVPAIVNGTPGVLYGTWDQPQGVLGFTMAQGKIAELNLITDRGKLHHLQLSLRLRCTERHSTA